jgi:hypothetical protein
LTLGCKAHAVPLKPQELYVTEAEEWKGMRKKPVDEPAAINPAKMPDNLVGGLPENSIWRNMFFTKPDGP